MDCQVSNRHFHLFQLYSQMNLAWDKTHLGSEILPTKNGGSAVGWMDLLVVKEVEEEVVLVVFLLFITASPHSAKQWNEKKARTNNHKSENEETPPQ